MVASACLTLAAIHLLVWCSKRLGGARLAFVIVAALCWLFPSQSQAAQPTFRSDAQYLIDTWETEDGLPENSATAMVQTPDGYLWFGTWNGLVRFDGEKFAVFNPGNTPQLPNAGIVNLHFDQREQLWVSTLQGLVVRKGAQWRTFGTNEGWVGNYVRTFAERANGDLLITTFDGHVLEFVNGRLIELPAPPGKPGQGYLAHVDEAGQWWVVQDWFVGRWDGQRWVATVRFREPYIEGIACGTAPDGSLLLLANQELVRYRQGAEVQRVLLKERPDSVWSVTEDTAGNVWMASYANGLSCLQRDGGFKRWQADGLVYPNTRFVFEDRERNLWVGTRGGGLMRFKPRRFRALGAEAGLAERTVQSIWPDASRGLWIGSFGLGLFHLGAAGITNVPLPGSDSAVIYAQSVLQDRASRVWVGTLGRGMWLLDGPGSRWIPAAQTGGGTISALFEDSRGRVWIGGDKGLAVSESGAFRIVEREGNSQIGGVVCFDEDREGVLWLSNLEAVFRAEKGRFVEVRKADGQPLRGAQCFKPETNGTMWMGIRGDGLWRWRDGRIDRVGLAAGFPVRSVNAIVEDTLGYFWMPSNRGIVRAAQKDLHAVADGAAPHLECQLLDSNDGLPSEECPAGQPTCARDGRGRLWFATRKGVAMIDPASFRLNSLPPPVWIEQIEYQPSSAPPNQRYRPSSGHSGIEKVRLVAPFPKPLRLPPGSYGLEVEYTALSFSSPEKVRFQTRLEGRGQEWEEAQGLRNARFHQLEPGDYVFRVRAANNDGVWNETGASLAFTVLPFYWQTTWFKLLGLVALSAVVYGAIRRRFTRLEKARAAQHAFARQLILSQENERKRVAAELHDGLGQNLLLIKNRLALAATRQADADELTRQLNAATDATARAIGEVRTISHALRPAALEQVGLTNAIEWMVEELGEGSTTRFSTELENIDGLLAPEMEVNLFRIIQEGLNNISRHAAAARVILEVKREAGGIRISLFDDGRGFEAEKWPSKTDAKPGIGLASMEERAKYLGSRLDVQSAPGRGTRLTVNVPLPLQRTKP